MSDLLLTAAERDRFATWLEREAATAKGLAAQAEKINAAEFIVKKLRAEAAAALIIASKLRSTEEFSP